MSEVIVFSRVHVNRDDSYPLRFVVLGELNQSIFIGHCNGTVIASDRDHRAFGTIANRIERVILAVRPREILKGWRRLANFDLFIGVLCEGNVEQQRLSDAERNTLDRVPHDFSRMTLWLVKSGVNACRGPIIEQLENNLMATPALDLAFPAAPSHSIATAPTRTR